MQPSLPCPAAFLWEKAAGLFCTDFAFPWSKTAKLSERAAEKKIG